MNHLLTTGLTALLAVPALAQSSPKTPVKPKAPTTHEIKIALNDHSLDGDLKIQELVKNISKLAQSGALDKLGANLEAELESNLAAVASKLEGLDVHVEVLATDLADIGKQIGQDLKVEMDAKIPEIEHALRLATSIAGLTSQSKKRTQARGQDESTNRAMRHLRQAEAALARAMRELQGNANSKARQKKSNAAAKKRAKQTEQRARQAKQRSEDARARAAARAKRDRQRATVDRDRRKRDTVDRDRDVEYVRRILERQQKQLETDLKDVRKLPGKLWRNDALLRGDSRDAQREVLMKKLVELEGQALPNPVRARKLPGKSKEMILEIEEADEAIEEEEEMEEEIEEEEEVEDEAEETQDVIEVRRSKSSANPFEVIMKSGKPVKIVRRSAPGAAGINVFEFRGKAPRADQPRPSGRYFLKGDSDKVKQGKAPRYEVRTDKANSFTFETPQGKTLLPQGKILRWIQQAPRATTSRSKSPRASGAHEHPDLWKELEALRREVDRIRATMNKIGAQANQRRKKIN